MTPVLESERLVLRGWRKDDLLGLPPLMSFVHPENLPSQAVVERLGATPLPPTTLRGEPRLCFRHAVPA
ncbi:GNAT family N-acetyltransferase [Chelativorans alearense]|uniref:GNAT family N-acetyltransferase n=1 Tax=Chelativorans alearense TaxID=2681495 RepID=UPI0013D0A21D|nr:GNAT family N-acetyltransferase [Chelativorans alearense]